jgi:hypothetical protein
MLPGLILKHLPTFQYLSRLLSGQRDKVANELVRAFPRKLCLVGTESEPLRECHTGRSAHLGILRIWKCRDDPMRRFGEVDFPPAILAAQREGKLVVFAGAGVSMPPPSNLPSFWKLAEMLAAGTTSPTEPLDQFLGCLPPELKIHERTRSILSGSASKPNALHRDLLRVFLRPQNVRLVTTNFDNHFATAAEELFPGALPELFAAPALPVGSQFSGIVHIHGSITRDPSRLVITDQDFGRAYLTEGWARRFIQDVFLNYVVLFVGYSHSDPVMHHLARGLPPGASNNRRFILVSDEKDDHRTWVNLGITDVVYPLEPDRDHSSLQVCLEAWASSIVATPTETRERVRKIVAKPPEPTGEDITFIEACLGNLAELRYFTEFANSLEWLRWIEGRDAFQRLLSTGTATTDADWELARWFARCFACDHGGTALDLIHRNRSVLPQALWGAIAETIWRRMVDKQYPPLLDKWTALLIEQHPGERGVHILSYMLKDCRLPEDDNSLYLLLRHLLQPVMRLEPSFTNRILNPDGEPDVDPKVEVRGDITWLAHVWHKIQTNHLPDFAYRLWPLVSLYIEQATVIFKSFRQGTDDWDPITFNLDRLDTPSISLDNNGLAILIKIALACFDWFVANDPDQAEACVVSWWNADCLTLKRTAIWGLAALPFWSPDKKVTWLVQKQILRNPAYEREFLRVLGDSLQSCSDSLKTSVIEESKEHYPKRYQPEMRDYVLYQIFVKLREYDPSFDRLRNEILALEQRSPELSPRPVESADTQETEIQAEEATLTEKELVELSTDRAAGRVLKLLDEIGETRRRALLGTVSEALRSNSDWGIGLANELAGRNVWQPDLWSTVVGGLNTGSLTVSQWESVLTLLADHPKIGSLASYQIVALLEQGIRSESHGISDPQLTLAMRVAEQTWQFLETQAGREVPHSDEWLSNSINDTAGILMQFEVRAISRLRAMIGDAWTGFTSELRDHLTSVVENSSWAGQMARVLLASQIHIFFYLDPAWTRLHMFKIFDWESDGRRAQQAWHGYLFWGRWTNPFLEEFLQYYIDTIPHIATDLGRTRDSFSDHLAAIAVYGSIPPLENGWLWTFIREAPPEDRSRWAHAVGLQLDHVTEDQKSLLWNHWMERYWEERLDGPYPPLSPSEVGAMIQWGLKMGAQFPEIVDLALRSPAPVKSGAHLYLTMKDSNVLASFPKESAVLLAHLMRHATPEFDTPVYDMVRRLAPVLDDRTKLFEICEELTRQGSTGVDYLRSFIESPTPWNPDLDQDL